MRKNFGAKPWTYPQVKQKYRFEKVNEDDD